MPNNDIDYIVVKNKVTQSEHLVVQPEERINFSELSTACGLKLKDSNIFYLTKETRKFWRNPLRCRNCTRAAKH